ncbi:MAG: hypothetical protein JXR48_08450 [Candidatus Delongbacteria bacterium]|nr:hypothetical protein [Candidatus Delongbacteria bacterium]
MFKKIITFLLLFISVILFANYSMDSNKDGKDDIWIKEGKEEIIISSDKDFNGSIDSNLTLDSLKRTVFEETDYNQDGIMDNFCYYEDGFIVRQEVDSNFDQIVDIWVYIKNNGKFIYKYEKDVDFDGVVDKIKEFEEHKNDGE